MLCLSFLICIAGLLIVPWVADSHIKKLAEARLQYEEEHKEELYGTDIMHVDSEGNIDIKDWK